ncbi:glycerate kinase [Thauera linaloolentis]|uniref:Glycerate kinase n=1 Tax=Thauera linaloolentis (strain DSM 12138 / JCM 21573 / CCUG 41526 / CIP 105981 / IAM 15112 / NBRC 102519 / 47Lol) TaxID=1123367 RepID=N6YV53_THAL4|nr:glycerate kinase [Thauera linaloolentis]ENO83839.1 glycerate kinase [Thauera linaloolentis 47Lol = DSM 12138]MCM8567352.1 glycerate kinase [Thauera linaloolentis]
MKKIVIAPDSYKESLSALEVARAVEAGFRAVFPQAEYVLVPVADGGEGTVEAMVAATGGRRLDVAVSGPLGDSVPAFYGLTGDGATAVIEMAAASGLMLVPPAQRDPLRTTSRGTGELIRAALDAGARHFILGIGGSATNDGGAGMVQALGARLLDADGRELPPGGGALGELARIDVSALDPRLAACRIEVACDVDNPLTGPRGASAVFGPQKGATAAGVRILDDNLARFARIVERDLGVAVDRVPGAGAAGGMGAAMLAFFGAELKPGIEIVTAAVELDRHVRDADLVVTGEGRIDFQTIHGKTPIGVARVAKRHGKPVIGIAGSLGENVGVVHEHGIDAVFSVLHRPCSLEEALRDAAANVELTARNVAAGLRIGMVAVALR